MEQPYREAEAEFAVLRRLTQRALIASRTRSFSGSGQEIVTVHGRSIGMAVNSNVLMQIKTT